MRAGFVVLVLLALAGCTTSQWCVDGDGPHCSRMREGFAHSAWDWHRAQSACVSWSSVRC